MSKIFDLIEAEQARQDTTIELIASENFVSEDVMKAVGSCLTNKYCEGYPELRSLGNEGRYYGGCQIVDQIEEYCREMWQKVFKTDYHVNVQPHSGSQANQAAYAAILKPGDTILSLQLNDGGHLTHGSNVNFSGKLYNFVFYNVTPEGFIDYNDIKEKIAQHKPNLVLAGYSAYPRTIDFKRIKTLIEEQTTEDYNPYFMVDMAHIAGLIAAEEHPTPFGLADIITTTTHKTLRGPRGGMIFCKPELAKKVDSAVFPGSQGGPLMHVIAGKAVAAEECLKPEYKEYIQQVIKNCKAMAEEFAKRKMYVVTGGTENHLLLLDLSKTHPTITGKKAQETLDKFGISLNKNCIHGEKRSPKEASGLRIGTAAMTSKGYKEEDFIKVADKIVDILNAMTWLD